MDELEQLNSGKLDELEQLNGGMLGARPNMLMGIVGAFLGALLGGAIWVVINQFGVIAAIAGWAIISFACIGYQKLGKELDLKGVIISIIVAVLVLMASHYLCWGIDLYKEFIIYYDITFIDMLLAMPSIVFVPDVLPDFIRDFAIGIVFIAFGAFSYIKHAIRGPKMESEMSAIENEMV